MSNDALADADDALRKYAAQVQELLHLYRLCSRNPSAENRTNFTHQLVVVEALTAVAIMPVMRVNNGGQPT